VTELSKALAEADGREAASSIRLRPLRRDALKR